MISRQGTDPVRSHLVVSPHPDDAVWSLGGFIAAEVEAGRPVTVMTVFGGSVELDPGSEVWRRLAATAPRFRENRAALSDLGADDVHLSFVDAALRSDEGVGTSPDSGGGRCRRFAVATPDELFVPDGATLDEGLISQVAQAIVRHTEPDTVVHAPFGTGRHVDHLIARRAAERTGRQHLRYYADVPYVFGGDVPRPTDLLIERRPIDIDRWLRAASRYRSQIRALFDRSTAFESGLRAWAERCAAGQPWRYGTMSWIRPPRGVGQDLDPHRHPSNNQEGHH